MDIILKYFPELNETQINQLKDLGLLYEEWNSKINLISRKDMGHFYERHVLHSLGIAKCNPFVPGTTILDVGTGGGFPGIPLAIIFPESNFLLVDAIGKKITVVKEVTASIKLTNVEARQVRAEELKDKYDFVVSRGVARSKPFYEWVKTKILKSNRDQKSGILYLKGGDLSEELAELNVKTKTFNLNDFFSEEFFETKKVIYVPF